MDDGLDRFLEIRAMRRFAVAAQVTWRNSSNSGGTFR
jgi:hypothetical protein